jgi:hypothetical protein
VEKDRVQVTQLCIFDPVCVDTTAVEWIRCHSGSVTAAVSALVCLLLSSIAQKGCMRGHCSSPKLFAPNNEWSHGHMRVSLVSQCVSVACRLKSQCNRLTSILIRDCLPVSLMAFVQQWGYFAGNFARKLSSRNGAFFPEIYRFGQSVRPRGGRHMQFSPSRKSTAPPYA